MRLENFFTAYKNDLISRQKSIEEAILNGETKETKKEERSFKGFAEGRSK